MPDKAVEYIFVITDSPAPSDINWYVSQVLKSTVKGVSSFKGIKINAAFNVHKVNSDNVLLHASNCYGDDILNLGKYDLIHTSFTDADGGNGMILVAYVKE